MRPDEEELRTDRLRLRPWTTSAADLARLEDIYRRDEVTRWIGGPPTVPTPDLPARWAAVHGADRRVLCWAVGGCGAASRVCCPCRRRRRRRRPPPPRASAPSPRGAPAATSGPPGRTAGRDRCAAPRRGAPPWPSGCGAGGTAPARPAPAPAARPGS